MKWVIRRHLDCMIPQVHGSGPHTYYLVASCKKII